MVLPKLPFTLLCFLHCNIGNNLQYVRYGFSARLGQAEVLLTLFFAWNAMQSVRKAGSERKCSDTPTFKLINREHASTLKFPLYILSIHLHFQWVDGKLFLLAIIFQFISDLKALKYKSFLKDLAYTSYAYICCLYSFCFMWQNLSYFGVQQVAEFGGYPLKY